ncbi:MAG: BamA/TamA family outer membrane protein [Bdellovibrio sp.]|nr:BamA/TamA family outer membrane protein [Bdellovibrio sp.]
MKFYIYFLLFFTTLGFSAEKEKFDIDRVELFGATVMNQQNFEALLELSVGESFERIKLIRTLSNIENFYQSKGYELVKVKSQFLRQKNTLGLYENFLRIIIDEGLPSRVFKIKILPKSIRGRYFQTYWDKKVNQLLGLFPINEGDLLDQEQIQKGKKALLNELAAQEFVGSKIEDVHIVTVQAPSQLNLKAYRFVNLEVSVELGDHVTFGFRDNFAFTKNQLLSFIEEQKATGFGSDYINVIKNRLLEEYKSLGYAHVQIQVYTFEKHDSQEKHITFNIQENERVKIENIEFDGNLDFSGADLKNEFFKVSSILIQNRYFVEKDISSTTEKLIEWLKSQGYLSARLIAINKLYLYKKHSVKLVIYIYEGEQTQIDRIYLTGARAFSKNQITDVLGIEEKKPLNLFSFNEGIEKLKKLYNSKSYWNFQITNEGKEDVVVYSYDHKLATISLVLQEGYAYKASRIEVEGLQSIKEEIIRREHIFGEGDLLEEDKISSSEISLRKLGIFSSVYIRLLEDEKKAGFKIVRISVTEGTPGVIAGGIGYRNDLGIRFFGQTAYTNLWKKNHTISLNTDIHRRFDPEFCANIDKNNIPHGGPCFVEYQAEIGYLWPWFFLNDTKFKPRFSIDRSQFLSFDAFTILLSFGLERPLIRKYNLTGALSYQLERVEQFHSLNPAIDDQTLLIGALVPSLRLDLRDNVLDPTSGFFSIATLEYAAPALLSQGDPFPVSYTRFQWRTDFFIPLWKNIAGFFSFRMGFAKNFVLTPVGVSDQDLLARKYTIPLSKQFALGGAGSLRGFGEQSLTLTDDNTPVSDVAIRGTLSYVNYRFQVDFPFAGGLRIGPFLDAANLLKDRFSFGILRYGAGFGLHYKTPVGPINFDWGFNLAPRSGEDPYRFHLSIGVI